MTISRLTEILSKIRKLDSAREDAVANQDFAKGCELRDQASGLASLHRLAICAAAEKWVAREAT